MKKIILIFLLLLTNSCTSRYKYQIRDDKGDYYMCNFYNKIGNGCILFNDKPGLYSSTGTPTIVCSPYSIRKLK